MTCSKGSSRLSGPPCLVGLWMSPRMETPQLCTIYSCSWPPLQWICFSCMQLPFFQLMTVSLTISEKSRLANMAFAIHWREKGDTEGVFQRQCELRREKSLGCLWEGRFQLQATVLPEFISVLKLGQLNCCDFLPRAFSSGNSRGG